MTLKAKVTRLDHSGVDWSNGHFMYFRTMHVKKRPNTREDVCLTRLWPQCRSRTIRCMEANRLEPGMSLRMNSPLFRDLALKPMRLRTHRGKREICALHVRGGQRQTPCLLMG